MWVDSIRAESESLSIAQWHCLGGCTLSKYKLLPSINRSHKPGPEMEARLLVVVCRLVLEFLLQAESTRVELVPEKVALSSCLEALLGLNGKLDREGTECTTIGSLSSLPPNS